MNYSYDMYKPTKKQVMLPIIVLFVTLIIGGVLLLTAKSLRGEDRKISFFAPGTQLFNIEEPGSYTIYLTTQISNDKMHYSLPENFTGLYTELSLNDEKIVLTKIEDGYTYGEEGNQSKSYLQFEASKPGAYEFTTRVESDSISEIELAMGKTDENLGIAIGLVTGASLLILMGACQFIAYTVFNLGKWAYYYYKSKTI